MRAKQVEVPDRVLTEEEFEDLLVHAKRSLEWYATQGITYTRAKLVEKLLRKGYPKHTVEVCDDSDPGRVVARSLIEEALEYLEDIYLLTDDEAVARDLMDDCVRQGKSKAGFIAKCFQKGVERDAIDEVASDYPEGEAIKEALSQADRKYRGAVDKIQAYLLRRGFNWGAVSEAIRANH